MNTITRFSDNQLFDMRQEERHPTDRLSMHSVDESVKTDADHPHSSDRNPINLNHLSRLTDDTGLFQHAVYSTPNWDHGYCLDDNARMLQLLCNLRRLDLPHNLAQQEAERLLKVATTFVVNAVDRQSRHIRNFMGLNREWLETCGSDDAHGRGIWALATLACYGAETSVRQLSVDLLIETFPRLVTTTSPRAWAFGLLAASDLQHLPDVLDRLMSDVQKLARQLEGLFGAEIIRHDWYWPESSLTYANARIPHALIRAGELLDRDDFIERGLQLTDWLFNLQTNEEGHLSIVGNHQWCSHDGIRSTFDQQPIEAMCLADLLPALQPYRSRGDINSRMKMLRGWFLGENDRQTRMIDPETGGCFDGLMEHGANRNQGAESLIAWLNVELRSRQLQG